MSTGKTWQTQSTSSAETEALGAKLGARLRGGEVIELVSDLGGGKTTFVRGLARGAESKDRVASPTFTLSREYDAPGFTIVHFDFYRLGEAGIMSDEIAEFMHDPAYVVVIEWGDIVQDVLPKKRLTIKITQSKEGNRSVTYTYPEGYGYLIQEETA